MPPISASSVLQHIRVLDLTRVRAGPTAVRMLADFGADVVKVESPPGVDPNESMGGPRDGSDFQNLHRNKRSIALNLKSAEGVEIFKRLAKTADVVAENYRPDVKFRLGIDYESLKAINPRIILASVSGFGQDGPYRERPGFDQIAQGMGGLMAITGLPGQGPVRAGIAVADSSAGLYAALGIMLALIEREKSGLGQWVQTSLLQSQIAMNDFQAARYLMLGEVPGQAGNDHPTSIPTGVYQTRDGYINIAASGEGNWQRLCKAIGREDLIAHADFRLEPLRSKNRVALNAELNRTTSNYASKELIDALTHASVPCGPIYKMDEVFADPQVQHLNCAVAVKHPRLGEIKLVAQPVALSRTPAALVSATPELGEHTEAILTELGYSRADLARLKEQGVIA
jgi:crotonobetainyl-CoA:carnitine CoA-transferase CaiB-like acyl-CoA transferase